MTQAQVIHGTAQEILRVLQDMSQERQLTLIVPQESAGGNPQQTEEHFYLTATPEEFQQAFDALGKGNELMPQLPPEAFDRENLYDEARF